MHRSGPKLTPFGLLRWALSPRPAEFAALASALAGVWICELAIPFLLGRTVDAAITKHHGFNAIAELGAGILALTVILYLLHAVYLRGEARIVARATFDLRSYLYSRVITQPLSFFSENKAGEISHQIMTDAEVIDNHGIYLFADVPFDVLSVVGIFAVMLLTQSTLALLILATLTGAVLLSRQVGRPLGPMEKSARRRWSLMGGILHDTLAAMRTVKIFGRESHEKERLDRANAKLADAEAGAGRIIARLEPLLELIRASGVLLVVWYGAYLVYSDAITAGTLVAFIAYMERMNESIQNAGSYYRHYEQAKGALGHVAELIAKLAPVLPGGTLSVDGPLRIDLQEISFTYPERFAAVLKNASLAAEPGEIVAIMGANGSGKTTLMDIVLGLRTPSSGSVLIGGAAIEHWDASALRGAICAIPQDIVLFDGTLEENIRYGALDATDAEVGAAAKAAGLAHVIARLPRGLRNKIGDRGASLSGGERQRVALARALLARARVLVLDEPDATLDGDASTDLMQVLRQDNAGRVILVVTHNSRTAQAADRALLLHEGRLENLVIARARQEDHYLTVGQPDGSISECVGLRQPLPARA